MPSISFGFIVIIPKGFFRTIVSAQGLPFKTWDGSYHIQTTPHEQGKLTVFETLIKVMTKTSIDRETSNRLFWEGKEIENA